MSEDEEIYPKRYHNITCKPATGSHQESVMMGFCTVVYNPTCETAYRQVPIFTKKHNCWKHTRTIPVEQGCKCRHQ
ncbi:hypothetical protein TcasGA2_TC033131 [Tribolium castaneum]|nr:hypothetical protein TcasGA2_TC033131 [Tribolium castaneum]